MNKKKVRIHCVGVDEKIHTCEPDKDKTTCGITIKQKGKVVKDRDLTERFSCYTCTY